MFEQIECSEEDRNKICRIEQKKEKIFYEARRYYRPSSYENECESGWVLNDDPIGEESHFGKIFYSTCNDEKVDPQEKRYIAKVIRRTENDTINDMLTEMNIQQYVYEHCPMLTTPVYQIFVERNEQFVIMITDLIDGTTVKREMLLNIVKNSQEDCKRGILRVKQLFFYCKRLLKYLTKTCNVYHGDSHLNNFMIKPDNSVKIIDFGNGEILNDKSESYKDQKNNQSQAKINTSFTMIMQEAKQKTGHLWYRYQMLKILEDANKDIDEYDGLTLPTLEN